MNNKNLAIVGAVMLLTSIWGGAFVSVSVGGDHWMFAPTLFTAILLGIAGGVTLLSGVIKPTGGEAKNEGHND